MIKISRAVLEAEELEGVRSAFATGWLGMGSVVGEFEAALAAHFRAKHVIAVNTGTSALHLALDSLGVGPGDEVIVPSLTFVGSFQAIAMTGAVPVPCEVHPETLLMDLADVRRRITPRTKAVMPVHFCGSPCDMRGLQALRDELGLRIVEDAAHAFGSIDRGRQIGATGDIRCFSFDTIKTITCGEGGAIVCDDDAFAALAREKRVLGLKRDEGSRYSNERVWSYDVEHSGFRYHMSNINAAIGLAQLPKLDRFVKRRREVAARYDQAFADFRFLTLRRADYAADAPFMYVVRVRDGRRSPLQAHLWARDIETGVHYVPNHWHKRFSHVGTHLPLTDALGKEILTLPLHCQLSDADVATVIEGVQAFEPNAVASSSGIERRT